MGGSAGGGGYDYQAEAIAFVAAHGVAEQQLDWFAERRDVPIAVLAETGGPGDDLLIEVFGGSRIEVQVKHGLRKTEEFWLAIDRLTDGLAKDASLRAVLLVDTSASLTIRRDLRQDIIRLGDGRRDKLKALTEEVLARLRARGVFDYGIFRRFRIVVTDLEHSAAGRAAALALLRQVVRPATRCDVAWSVLTEEGHDLITRRGARTVDSFLQVLSARMSLSPRSESLIVCRAHYRRWLKESTSSFGVPGLGLVFPIEHAWIRLRVFDDTTDRRPNRATFARQMELYQEWARLAEDTARGERIDAEYVGQFRSRVVVIGGPGSGKSTLLMRMTNRLTAAGKLVLKVPLRQVALLVAKGSCFQDAVVRTATDGSSLTPAMAQRLLSAPDVFLADGLDECDPHRATIAHSLKQWVDGHPDCHVCVTTRPVDHDPALLPGFTHTELLPLDGDAIREHCKRLFHAAVDPASRADDLCSLFVSSLESEKETRTVRSLAARNPLLLGFLVRLAIDEVPFDGSRAELYQQVVELMYVSAPMTRRPPRMVSHHFAMCAVDAAGWSLTQSPGQELSETQAEVSASLQSSFDLSDSRALSLACRALKFWEERGLIERVTAGHLEGIAFVHPSLREFTAARRLSKFGIAEFHRQAKRVRLLPRWKQVVLLAAGLEKRDQLIDALLRLDEPDDPVSLEATLAAQVAAEGPGLDSARARRITTALQNRLASTIPLVSIEAARALLPLAGMIPTSLASIALPHIASNQPWTRLGAMALLLAAGSDWPNLADLKQWFRDFELVHTSIRRLRVHTENQAMPEEAYELQYSIVERAVRRLAAELSPREAAEFFDSLSSLNKFSVAMIRVMARELEQADLTDVALRLHQRTSLGTAGAIAGMVAGFKKERDGEVVFLNCVCAAAGERECNQGDKPEPPYLALSAMCDALSVGEAPAGGFQFLEQEIDLPVVIEILRGTMCALGLSNDTVRREASAALMLLGRPETSVFSLITPVSIAPQWHEAQHAALDPDRVAAGLMHPFPPIALGAANLMHAGVGGSRSQELLLPVLKRGGETALFFAAQMAKSIFGRKTNTVLLNRLEERLTRGCHHLLASVVSDLDAVSRDRTIEVIFRGLQDDDPRIAASVAESLRSLSPPLDAQYNQRLREVFDHWTERGSQCETHDRPVKGTACPECHVIPPSPREQVLVELARLGAWTVDELLHLCRDERAGVRNAAQAALAQMAAEDVTVFHSLLQEIDHGSGPVGLLRDLLALPTEAAGRVSGDIAGLLDSENAGIRAVIIGRLPDGWIDRGEALRLARRALDDGDAVVRTQAVRTLRTLSSGIGA